MKSAKAKINEIKNQPQTFAQGLMQMSQKGSLSNIRLTRARAISLESLLKEVIYYLPECFCQMEENCHCQDTYFAAIYWLRQSIYRVYPDLSAYQNATPALFPKTPLDKKTANSLRLVLNEAESLAESKDQTTELALEWAYNLIYQKYSVFELYSP